MKEMTKKALEEALAGESQAHIKYLAFAEKAEKEGHGSIARLFKAIAEAERVHATNHMKELGLLSDTMDNLKSAKTGEGFEIDEMYPAYNAVAELQEEKGAMRTIHYAEEAEKIHEALYEEAIETLKDGKDFREGNVYICPVCGYTHVGDDIPEKCPVCGVSNSMFKKFE